MINQTSREAVRYHTGRAFLHGLLIIKSKSKYVQLVCLDGHVKVLQLAATEQRHMQPLPDYSTTRAVKHLSNACRVHGCTKGAYQLLGFKRAPRRVVAD